jgi:hypothetical protein
MMRATWTGMIAAALLWGGVAAAQTPADCPKPGAPATVAGEVIKVDMNESRITLRASDGTVHEFNASKDTLKDVKVGDRLEAKLRKPAGCK